MKDIIIVGAGSVGGHIAANPMLYGIENRILGFLDDDEQKHNTEIFGFPVLGNIKSIQRMGRVSVIIGIAFPNIKSNIMKMLLKSKELDFPAMIAKNAWISSDCKIGKGAIIYPNVSINYNSIIGDFCIVNMNCALGHHVSIGKFTSLAPGVNIGGNTSIGDYCDIGIGVSILQKIVVSSNVIVGGQALVNRDLAADAKYVGVPAKSLKNK